MPPDHKSPTQFAKTRLNVLKHDKITPTSKSMVKRNFLNKLRVWAEKENQSKAMAELADKFKTLNSSELARNYKAMKYLLDNPYHLGDFSGDLVTNSNLHDFAKEVLNNKNPESVQLALIKALFDNMDNEQKKPIFANLSEDQGFTMEELGEIKNCQDSMDLTIIYCLSKNYPILSKNNAITLAKIGSQMIINLAHKGFPEHIDLSPKKI